MTVDTEQLLQELRRALAADAGSDQLRELLAGLHPVDLTEALRALDLEERCRALEAVDPSFAAYALSGLEYADQLATIRSLPRPLAAQILAAMSSDDMADMLAEAEPEVVNEILALIPEEAAEVRTLMQYPERSAGGLMTPDYIAVPAEHTVEQTLEHLRTLKPDSETAYYVYVTDAAGTLVGVVSLRQLVIAHPQTKVGELPYGDVIYVFADTHQEEVARLFEKYDFLALPVVDHDRRLLGVVTVDDVIDVIHEETTEDITRLGGVEPLDEMYLSARPFQLVRKRLGWLLILFLAQSVTGNILGAFQETLATATVLAIFIPLLIGTGGNAGTQASTLVVRALAMGEVRYADVFKVIGREALVGALLGAAMAAVAFIWSQIFVTGFEVGITVGLTVFAIVVVASSVGALLPILARRLGFDPAIASAPLVATVTDASGLILYFLIAKRVLGL